MTGKEDRLVAYRRTVTIIAVIIVLYLSFLIIKPFLVAIIGAAVLAYIFYPTYRFFERHIPAPLPKPNLAALITLTLIVLIVLIPMVVITRVLAGEARSGYLFIQSQVNQPQLMLNSMPSYISEKIGDLSQFEEQIIDLASQLILWLQRLVRNLPGAFLNIFITVFCIYFFLKEGRNIYKILQEFFPLPEGRYKQIFSRFDELSRGMIMGQLVVGAVQGVLAWLAFFYLAVPNPVLWGFLTAIISIIPLLGAALVWVPVAGYLLLMGYMTGVYWKAIALFFYGMLVISSIDNILKPKIVGDRAKIHPLFVLFGILGGIQLMGLPGILIGPLILALFDVVMATFREVI